MITDKDLCPNCKQPKPGGASGSLTQWIFVCNCASLKTPEIDTSPLDGYRYQVCRSCKKRVGSGRDGSLTQFVFRSDSCRCEQPDILDVAIARPVAESFPDLDFDDREDSDDSLDLSQDSFPISRFKPIRELGKGSSGTVYLCRDRLLQTRVAVKMLHYLTADQLLSFQQEARAISRLNHPNIVKILDFGATDSGLPYMVLEYIDGTNLETMLNESGKLDFEEIVDILRSLLDALAYAHEKEIYHRDLKPSNMLVVDSGKKLSVKLVDFGVARVKFETVSPTVFEGTQVIGTPAYMSPDQMKGQSYDQRSEIYSLGCILFELLSGSPPLTGETVMETVAMHVNKVPPRLREMKGCQHLSAEVEALVARCLEKESSARFQNVLAMREALESVLSKESSKDKVLVDDQEPEEESQTEFEQQLQKTINRQNYGDASALRETGFKRMQARDFSPGGILAIAGLIGIISAAIYFGILAIQNGPAMSVQESSKAVSKSKEKPGELENTLMETRFQINQFNGQNWYFNIAPINDEFIDDLVAVKKNANRLWLDHGTLSKEAILKMKPLGVVAIAFMNIELTPAHLDCLSQLHTIEALRLFDVPTFNDESINHLQGMHQLFELFIRSDFVSDEGIKKLVALENLGILSVDRCRKVTDKSIATIEQMKKLERLSLSDTSVTIDGVRRVTQMRNLIALSIAKLPCDSACIKALAKLNIKRLGLRFTKLRGADLRTLATIKSLELVDIRDNPAITKMDAIKFHQMREMLGLPACKLLWERRVGTELFGELVYETLDDENLWVESLE